MLQHGDVVRPQVDAAALGEGVKRPGSDPGYDVPLQVHAPRVDGDVPGNLRDPRVVVDSVDRPRAAGRGLGGRAGEEQSRETEDDENCREKHKDDDGIFTMS